METVDELEKPIWGDSQIIAQQNLFHSSFLHNSAENRIFLQSPSAHNLQKIEKNIPL